MSRLRMAAVAVLSCCAVMLIGAGTASAQDPTTNPAFTKKVAVTGENRGKDFSGVYTIERFENRGGQAVAVGTLKGTLKNRRVRREGVRMPVSGFGVASAAQSSQLVCRILTLQLGPLDLNLLGLRIQLNRINLRITAIPGGGLLGDLLCGIANLLNPPAILGNDLAAVLNSLLALVPTRPTG